MSAAGRAVDNKADAMAAFDLRVRQIDDVPEQSAERRAQHMQDLQAGRLARGRMRRLAPTPTFRAAQWQPNSGVELMSCGSAMDGSLNLLAKS